MNSQETQFLPISRKEMEDRGWDQVDFAYVLGDAYVDHPSFGAAIISRLLEANGYRVGIISQPDWKDRHSIDLFGRPRLGFLVSAGNMDSLVNHYTVAKKRRNSDAYTPGGCIGKRPDRAVIVYCNLIRSLYPDAPIIIGGVEASLRRLAHYDYWSNKVRRSILLDAQADLLSYGMGERSIIEIAEALSSGLKIQDITFIPGTAYATKSRENVYDALTLPSFAEITQNKRAYAESFRIQYQNADPFTGKRLLEPYGEKEFVVVNPPAKPLSQPELDQVYGLPYTRKEHPSYAKLGGVPATQEIKFSLTSCRGCFGSCNFCALTFHQGRIVTARSHESLCQEAQLLTKDPDFKGYIHDIGGPTADMRHPACAKQGKKGSCPNRQCLFPTPCPNLDASHTDYLQLLRKLRKIPGIKKVFIRSGIRFDYVLAEKNDAFLKEIIAHHISGRLKLAPEHISDQVLRYMGKPPAHVYEAFLDKYRRLNAAAGQDQYIEPYLMSSHPGSSLKEAIELAEWLRDHHIRPPQVQDFYPTPSTVSTCMYYTGLDPRNMEPVYVTRNPHEKALQRALIHYREEKNWALVREALYLAKRTDLIGFGPNCLIPPRPLEKKAASTLPSKCNHNKYHNNNEKSVSGKQKEKKRGNTARLTGKGKTHGRNKTK